MLVDEGSLDDLLLFPDLDEGFHGLVDVGLGVGR